MFPKDLSVQEAYVKRMQEVWNEEKEALDDLGHSTHQLNILRSQAMKIQDKLAGIQKQMTEVADKRRGSNIRDSMAVVVIGSSDAMKEKAQAIEATFASIKSSK
jgi:hypothetical protein